MIRVTIEVRQDGYDFRIESGQDEYMGYSSTPGEFMSDTVSRHVRTAEASMVAALRASPNTA